MEILKDGMLKRTVGAIVILILIFMHPVHAESERTYQLYNASNGLLDNSAQQIVCLDDGRMVISTLGNINFFDGSDFYYVPGMYNMDYPLKDYRGNWHFYQDRHNHYWLKNKGLVYCISEMSELYVDVLDVFKSFKLKNQVTDLFCTQDRGIWFVENSSTLYGYDSNFRIEIPKGHGELQDLEQYNQKEVQLYFRDGTIVVYDLQTHEQLYTSQPFTPEMQKKYCNSIVLLSKNNYTYQLRNGDRDGIMLVFDSDKKEWKTLLEVPYHLNNMALKDDSTLFVASEYGLWIYQTATGEIAQRAQFRLADGSYIATDVNTLAFDHQGGLWVGTEKRGVLYGRPLSDSFVVHKWNTKATDILYPILSKVSQPTEFLGRTVKCVLKDNKYTWVGTNEGLLLYEGQKLIKTFKMANGLPNNVVHSIIKDNEGFIWFTTSNGISRLQLDPGTLEAEVRNFHDEDGAIYDYYEDGKIALLGNGNIIVQGMNYITEFSPEKTTKDLDDRKAPRNILSPIIVGLYIKGEKIEGGKKYNGRVISNNCPSKEEHFEFEYGQNNVAFVVSAVNYYRPKDTYFRYRLLGSGDESWKTVSSVVIASSGRHDNKLRIAYQGLKVGEYILEIQASPYKDFKDAKSRIVTLTLHQAWWKNTGLKILVLIFILGILFANMRTYQKNLSLKIKRDYSDSLLVDKLHSYLLRCRNATGSTLSPIEDGHIAKNQPLSDDEKTLIAFAKKLTDFNLGQDSGKTDEVTLEHIIEKLGCSRTEFYDLSRKLFDSPQNFMITVFGLENAANMLKTTKKAVGDISIANHFISEEYFRQCFFFYNHQSPEEFRESE